MKKPRTESDFVLEEEGAAGANATAEATKEAKIRLENFMVVTKNFTLVCRGRSVASGRNWSRMLGRSSTLRTHPSAKFNLTHNPTISDGQHHSLICLLCWSYGSQQYLLSFYDIRQKCPLSLANRLSKEAVEF